MKKDDEASVVVDRKDADCLVLKEPAPIRNADMERVVFEEFRGQQELDSSKANRLDG